MAFKPETNLETHRVFNQPEPRESLALWAEDAPLRQTVERLAPAHAGHVAGFAATVGASESLLEARQANRCPPELKTFDRAGRRLDEVEFHPAYHELMRKGLEGGYSALAWTAGDTGGHLAHAAMVYLLTQVEPGVCCPMTMTYAAIPALAAAPDLAARWRPGLTSARYDPAVLPAHEKAGLTIGMAMTEKQGGSDLRANQTRAERDGSGYRLFGHKWFCSAPMSDAFLTLAQTGEGLTCFLVPRWQPDDTRNAIHLMRLKDKLGNRANASAEIEYHGAWAERVGEPGRGVPTIIEMVHHTRLDTAMAPAGLMRRALSEAAWWARNRMAFGMPLVEQPLMRSVLTDLTLDWLGSLAIGLRVAQSFDAASDSERAFARLAVALAKYWSNKRCPAFVAEAMECLGGSGYVEEGPMPWLYREAPLNAIWEGSGNIVCLDVLRTIRKQPEALDALAAELAAARGADRRFDAALDATLARYSTGVQDEEARHFVERLALLLQASLLLRHGDQLAASAFIRTRLDGEWGRTFGTLPEGIDAARLVAMI
ncbi:acyl-CoA dehydrogenase [Youhaiella tibetensis]|uniref:DNA alkylation response protein n=1 Tax=Paradevosia tibetensis TaxID=1447062 RepID=A0A5B9DLJ9_9HYPH|nr:acyl-CoA dehydrogenase family protein [Youhaiella tibetensis]QEE19278.1 DNA alkylation response protein [Youhaiella tibetensis]GGF34584.1 acyl-CoA dehydrogenase [Youhaiella tibetensis]